MNNILLPHLAIIKVHFSSTPTYTCVISHILYRSNFIVVNLSGLDRIFINHFSINRSTCLNTQCKYKAKGHYSIQLLIAYRLNVVQRVTLMHSYILPEESGLS